MARATHYTPEQWEAHRAEIRRLYIDEDRTLHHVMTAMSLKGFTATTKMYKTKLRHWKLFKNNRAADVAAILRSQSQRAAVGKESILVRNGRRVDTQTYLKRKGVGVDDLLQLAASSSSGNGLPGHLRCVTPPPLSDPMTGILRSSPGRLRIKEVLGGWVLGECGRLGDGMGSAMMVDSGIECEPSEKERPLLCYYDGSASKVVAEYYDAIWAGRYVKLTRKHCRLVQKSIQSPQGWNFTRSVFWRLHTLLDDCEHLLYPLLNLLMIILTLPPSGTPEIDKQVSEIHRQLWDYLSTIALSRFGAEHPVPRMLAQLKDLFETEEDEDEKYGLLHSVVSDAVATLGARMQEDGYAEHSRQTYFDLVSLWYAETLRSHRGHGRGYKPQLHLEQEDLFSILDGPADPSGVGTEDGDGNDEAEESPGGHLVTIQSYLLLDHGWATSWREPAVYDSCVALLHSRDCLAPDETEVNCFTAMALYNRAQVDRSLADSPPPGLEQARQYHELARHFLRVAVTLDWELSGASIYNLEGLLLLQNWCTEAEDWTGLEAVRQRSEECLGVLFGEWGV